MTLDLLKEMALDHAKEIMEEESFEQDKAAALSLQSTYLSGIRDFCRKLRDNYSGGEAIEVVEEMANELEPLIDKMDDEILMLF